MSLAAGSRIGPYEVLGSLGAGGMGEVYRATDTTLGRQVAIKILPDAFAADPDRLARFEREAKTLASLNHPHIAAIHGFEKSSGVQALVMELVEGEDLSQRIARGAIPLDEALPIAKQIAEALEAAHEQGIIHRDLKPANIKVRADGTVKVLDFGLAKAIDPPAASGATAMNSPTLSVHATQAGIILGTAAYMSPEQARGKAVDKRADIWAFGAVLYEMLTGARAFPGDDLTDTLAAVVRAEPDWSVVPKDVSPTVLVYLKRCLQKDVKQRVGDIHDVRLALEGAFDTAAASAPATHTSAPTRSPLPWMAALGVAALVIVALAVPAVRYLRQAPPPAPPETRTDIVTPATDLPEQFALSPDGRQIVFAASSDGTSRLWLRSLSTTVAQPLAGTEGATYPFWSPDSRSLAFFAGGQLKRLDLGGGAPQALAPAGSGRGGTWCADGMIVFAPSTGTPLVRVPATGGDVTALTSLGPGQQNHRFPQVLPDGRRFLFYAQGAPDAVGIYLGSLDGGAPTRLTSSADTGVYLPNAAPGNGRSTIAPGEGGWLLWVREGTLVAQWLDDATSTLIGERITLAGEAVTDSGLNLSAVSASATGLVAYRAGGANRRRLLWFDRSGAEVGAIGDPDATSRNPRLSPDGRRVVLARTVQGNVDLWLIDGARMSRFTFDAANENFPEWSPDGARILFRSSRSGPGTIYQRATNGAAEEEVLPSSSEVKTPMSVSTDGRFLLFLTGGPDIWVKPLTGDGAPVPFLTTRFREMWGAFSPDGRWVAYTSDESGRNEVYVRAFVPPSAGSSENQRAGQWQVSATGGANPVWRRDGRELYFLSPTGEMMAAPIVVTPATLEAGTPARLFQTRIVGGGSDLGLGRQYDVAPDGRFLINTMLESAAAPITIIQNWRPPGEK